MRTLYDIKQEMNDKFGKDFIDIMKYKKKEFERLQKELEEAKIFDAKVNDKNDNIRKSFVYINDNYTIYPDEICSQFRYRFAKQCIEENLLKEDEKKLSKEMQIVCLDNIESDAKRLLEIIKEKRKEI